MGFLKKLFSKSDKKQEALDYDSVSGSPLYKDDIINEILTSLEDRRQERKPLENQWILNSNFLSGNQYCDINTTSGYIEQTDAAYEWLERETFNRISPIIQTRIANLKKLKYIMSVKPRTNELDDYAKASISTELLRYNQNVTDFDSIKNTALWWNEICGSVFFLSWWDPSKGEEYAREQVSEIGENNVANFKEIAYYEGDIDYGIVSAFEVFPESIFKQTVKEQRTVIIEQVKSVEEIFDLYGIEVDGGDIDTFSLAPVEMATGQGSFTTVNTLSHVKAKKSAKVVTYFERPNRRRPDGRLIIIIGDKELAYYGPLPYREIPIAMCRCIEVAGMLIIKFL